MDGSFKHRLGDTVALISGEKGEVTGRAEYSESPAMYQLRYINTAGSLEERWWPESAIAAGAGN